MLSNIVHDNGVGISYGWMDGISRWSVCYQYSTLLKRIVVMTRMQRMRMASTVTSCLSHGALKVPVGHRQLWRTHKIDTHTHTVSHRYDERKRHTQFHTHTQTQTHTQMASIASHDAKMVSLKHNFC